MKLAFNAYIKKFTKKNLVSLDSELEITIRTNDMSIVNQLNELSRPDETVIITVGQDQSCG